MSEPLILERRSGYYGLIKFRYLGTIDLRLMKPEDEELLDKWHPAIYFPSRWAVKHRDDGHSWSEWVPTRADNQNWKPRAGTPYHTFAPKHKELPIAHSEKSIEKWLTVLGHLLIDNPDAMAEGIAARNEMESTL